MRVMGPALVVELPPAFDEYLSFGTVAEPIPVQQFVTQLAVEALDEPILLPPVRHDEGLTDCGVSQPVHDFGSGKFGVVVRANECGPSTAASVATASGSNPAIAGWHRPQSQGTRGGTNRSRKASSAPAHRPTGRAQSRSSISNSIVSHWVGECRCHNDDGEAADAEC